jgi:hypothetical protein
MKNYFPLLLVVIQSVCVTNLIYGREKSKIEEPTIIAKKLILPDQLIATIEDKFSRYTIPTEKDYPKDLLSAISKNALPYVCWGDFNGDKLIDIVIILIEKGYKPPAYQTTEGKSKLVVFHKTKSGYEPHVLIDSHPVWWDYIIGTLSSRKIITAKGKGYAADPNDSDYIYPKFDSISFKKWESASSVFYWEKGQYKRVWTSD